MTTTYQEVWKNLVGLANEFRTDLDPVWLVIATLLGLLVLILATALASRDRLVSALQSDLGTAKDHHRDLENRLRTQAAQLKANIEEL